MPPRTTPIRPIEKFAQAVAKCSTEVRLDLILLSTWIPLHMIRPATSIPLQTLPLHTYIVRLLNLPIITHHPSIIHSPPTFMLYAGNPLGTLHL